MPRKRLTYLDMAKGIGIFLVILGHIEYIREDTLKWISSFHMPLFFVIGGILAYEKREEGRPLFSALAARARGTLVPYAAFTIMLLTMNTLEHFLEPGAGPACKAVCGRCHRLRHPYPVVPARVFCCGSHFFAA